MSGIVYALDLVPAIGAWLPAPVGVLRGSVEKFNMLTGEALGALHHFSSWPCVGFIEALLAAGRPSTVSGLVVSVVVWISIQRMLWCRPSPHVINEVGNGVFPALAYQDSAPSPFCETGVFRIKASGLHLSPRHIFGAWRLVDVFAMIQAQSSMFAPVKLSATATLLAAYRAASKLVRKCLGGVSARARAVPLRCYLSPVWPSRMADYRQLVKCEARKISARLGEFHNQFYRTNSFNRTAIYA